jgi:hypothetical protein
MGISIHSNIHRLQNQNAAIFYHSSQFLTRRTMATIRTCHMLAELKSKLEASNSNTQANSSTLVFPLPALQACCGEQRVQRFPLILHAASNGARFPNQTTVSRPRLSSAWPKFLTQTVTFGLIKIACGTTERSWD